MPSFREPERRGGGGCNHKPLIVLPGRDSSIYNNHKYSDLVFKKIAIISSIPAR